MPSWGHVMQNMASHESLIEFQSYVLCVESDRPQGDKVLNK